MKIFYVDYGVDKSYVQEINLETGESKRIVDGMLRGSLHEQAFGLCVLMTKHQPKQIVMDSQGMGLAFKDTLVTKLDAHGIKMYKDGNVYYPDEEY